MLRKSIIFFFVTMLVLPMSAQAQTMDIVMKLQSIMDQVSEIKAGLKQVESSMNIKEQLKNLGGGGNWKDALKNAAGGVFDSSSASGAEKKSLLLLPEGLADKADDPEAVKKWMNDTMYITKKNASFEEVDQASKKFQEFQFMALMTGYGKAVSMRKQLDKDIEKIEELRQEAEAKESETDLQNEINKVALLKLEQETNKQLLKATASQISAALLAKDNQLSIKKVEE